MPHPEAVQALVDNQGLWRSPLAGRARGRGRGCRGRLPGGHRLECRRHRRAGLGRQPASVPCSTSSSTQPSSESPSPTPAIFTYALDALGVEAADTWYVGDSPLFDRGGAEAAGLAEFVLVDPTGLQAGYEPRIANISELLGLLQAVIRHEVPAKPAASRTRDPAPGGPRLPDLRSNAEGGVPLPAEGVGFEPTEPVNPAQQFSRLSPSSARPSLHPCP